METVEDLSGGVRAQELAVSHLVSTFHTTTLALPIPGAMGEEASIYLAFLEMQGLTRAAATSTTAS